MRLRGLESKDTVKRRPVFAIILARGPTQSASMTCTIVATREASLSARRAKMFGVKGIRAEIIAQGIFETAVIGIISCGSVNA